MNKHSKDRLHLFRQVEEVLREMNLSEVKECSEATLACMKRIFKALRQAIFGIEAEQIRRWRAEGKLSPKNAIHRIALLKKKYF